MALDTDKVGAFVGVLIATLRAEIGEASQRGERLSSAVKHAKTAREHAEHALKQSRFRRAQREERVWRFSDDAAV